MFSLIFLTNGTLQNTRLKQLSKQLHLLEINLDIKIMINNFKDSDLVIRISDQNMHGKLIYKTVAQSEIK